MTTREIYKKSRIRQKRMHGHAVQSKSITIHVTRDDIENSQCGLPTKCMIKVALKRALNLAHGYIHVAADGISISRNGLYREKAFMPRTALLNMIQFDKEKDLPPAKRTVRPFKFKVTFFKTTKIATPERQAQFNANTRRRRARPDHQEKKYDMRSRVIGVAIAGGAQLAA